MDGKTFLPFIQQIETLTSYLPRLYAEGFSLMKNMLGTNGKTFSRLLASKSTTASTLLTRGS
jgi:hypothetical protein